ncbi:glycosyltransferase [Cypionkella sp.]|uniref:glycosyltransferase n=1 Tax=Cypionkella sp. TaxID=2811411 RepID=UPI002AB951D9|nr:glycosyltransferase [Cypionkella sp.]MDZ4393506.1 glycosyltransferase [Cypionkella sp.]
MQPPKILIAPQILIALCSYNGADWLAGQLDSIAAQDHANWALWISDDGSTDDTRSLIAAFQARHPGRDIRLIEGPRQGGTQNFLSLICHPELPIGPQTHLALCDQDDIWLPEKLSRALALLQAQPDASRPLIYGGQSRHIDEAGRVIGSSRRPRGQVTLQNAVVQNMVSGHSLVLNPAALALARAAGRPAGIGSQDWWLSLLVLACGGRAVIDQTEVLLYRQHGGNVMGAPQGGHAAKQRLRQMSDGRYRAWIAANLAGLAAVADRLTPEATQIIASLTQTRGGLARLRAFRRLGIRRQSGRGTALLYTACLLGWA